MNRMIFEVAKATANYLQEKYQQNIEIESLTIQPTRKDFEGDLTLVVFPLTRLIRKSPAETAHEIGQVLTASLPQVSQYNVVQGFLNLIFTDAYWLQMLDTIEKCPDYGFRTAPADIRPIVVEFSSPNTNKPLHLGHVRNNLLGHSVSAILAANGHKVVKVNLVNDRGVHICKSMLAWQKWGGGETPGSSLLKGDHLVGKYYVEFDKHFKEEVNHLINQGMKPEEAAACSPLMLEVREMLRQWEANNPEVRQLWQMMNNWVYDGFNETYTRMGIDFDKTYYESETYLKGKDLVMEGVSQGVLQQKEDGSVWIDLTADGLDEKLLLRSDGTSVYMTQDLGTAVLRHNDYQPERMIYVVGNEQNYHFDVLKIVLARLQQSWASSIQHLSYGMVELPDGKMKSREGTVVDADDLMEQMLLTAKKMTEELGKATDLSDTEANELYRKVSLAALKYFILKVDPRKNMLFNPSESIDFNGNTGPFIQYTYARIKSIMRKAVAEGNPVNLTPVALQPRERSLIRTLSQFPAIVEEAGKALSPALIANYCFELAKEFNQFYHEHSILQEPESAVKNLRLVLSQQSANVIRNGMSLLGIGMPERM